MGFKSRAASYTGLSPASPAASKAARASSKKRDTSCEMRLRRALSARGVRYRVDAEDLPGRPDIVFRGLKIAVFCDGDFWHGKGWEQRKQKLAAGHNADYWLKKIGGNIERDRRHTAELQAAGWTVLRFWESDIRQAPERVCDAVLARVNAAKNNGISGG